MSGLDESLRNAPVLDRGGYPYLVHPLSDGVPRCHPALLAEWVDWAAQRPMLQGATVLLAPEAMALPLAAALSLRVDIPYVVARKRQYGLAGEEVAYCETGYSSDCLYVNDIHEDDLVVVVEDVLSTGGTLDGILTTLASKGATIAGVLLLLDKGDRYKTAQRHDVAIDAMRQIRIADGHVAVEVPEKA